MANAVAGKTVLRVQRQNLFQSCDLVHICSSVPVLRPWRICVIGGDCRNWKQEPLQAGRRQFHCIRRADELERHSRRTEQSNDEFTSETNPAARTVASTQSEMTEIILPNDTNTLGNLLGGRLMHFIDLTGAMAAYRHSRTHVVTAAMDHIDFIRPVHVGDLLTLKSSVNRAFTTSMEVGVKVWVEHPQTGVLLHVASAYLVFVAIDQNGRRVRVPEVAAGDAG